MAGIMHMLLSASGGDGEVTVSGGSYSSTSAAAGATSRVTFNTDGTVDVLQDGVTTQVFASTDWVIPNGGDKSPFDIRYTLHSGNGIAAPAAEDTYVDFSANRAYSLVRVLASGVGTSAAEFTIQIRRDGVLQDSAVYNLSSTIT